MSTPQERLATWQSQRLRTADGLAIHPRRLTKKLVSYLTTISANFTSADITLNGSIDFTSLNLSGNINASNLNLQGTITAYGEGLTITRGDSDSASDPDAEPEPPPILSIYNATIEGDETIINDPTINNPTISNAQFQISVVIDEGTTSQFIYIFKNLPILGYDGGWFASIEPEENQIYFNQNTSKLLVYNPTPSSS